MAAAPHWETHPIGWATRIRMRLRHGMWIFADVTRHAAAERTWWLIPFVVVVGLLAAAILTAQAVVPVTVYTLF
jgi:hypothetical protein